MYSLYILCIVHNLMYRGLHTCMTIIYDGLDILRHVVKGEVKQVRVHQNIVGDDIDRRLTFASTGRTRKVCPLGWCMS